MNQPFMPMQGVVPTQSFATLAFLGSVPGLLIRQKTDWIGAILEVAAHANRYQLKPPPMGYDALSAPLDDRGFKVGSKIDRSNATLTCRVCDRRFGSQIELRQRPTAGTSDVLHGR
jgi:hypothetical protein